MAAKRRVAARSKPEPTKYLNVDLDIYSRVPLKELVASMGRDVLVLYVGGERQRYEAHLELASSLMDMTADRTIIGLTRLVKRLPPRYRKVWDSAKSREFNIGIEAGLEPRSFEVRLDRRTVDAVTEVGGTLAVTVYAPALDANEASPSKRREPRTSKALP